jgi:hypothetical protein
VSNNWICFKSKKLPSALQRAWLLFSHPTPDLRAVSSSADVRRRRVVLGGEEAVEQQLEGQVAGTLPA